MEVALASRLGVFNRLREATTNVKHSKTGKVFSVKQHERLQTFYHGTTSQKKAASIEKRGLVPKPWALTNDKKLSPTVWLTRSRKKAKFWAGKSGAVFQVRLPADKVRPLHYAMDTVLYRGHIKKVKRLKEATTRVKSYLKHSKRGRVFNVKQHTRTYTKAAAQMKIIGATPNEDKYIRKIMSRHPPAVLNHVSYVMVVDHAGLKREINKRGQRYSRKDARETLGWYDEPGDESIMINRKNMTIGLWKETLDHELGHAAYFNSSKLKAWDGALDKNSRAIEKDIDVPEFDQFTEYSKTNYEEAFAESYMAYMSAKGKAKNPRYAEVFNVVRKVLGGVKKKAQRKKLWLSAQQYLKAFGKEKPV